MSEKTVPVHKGKLQNGKLELRQEDKFKERLKNMDDGEVIITIKKPKKKRSPEQNRYYWSVIVEKLAEHIGYGKNEMHEELKKRFNSIELDSGHLWVKSTTTLEPDEFKAYCRDIRNWASKEFGLFIPKPNEFEFRERLKQPR